MINVRSGRVWIFLWKLGFITCVVLLASIMVMQARAPEETAFTDLRGTEHVRVTLREEGFVPHTIVVNLGTEVVFHTERGKAFWPASDVHPYHNAFPAFDPRQAVAFDEEWAYVFEKEGRWAYHDHLDAIETGMIIVAPDDIDVRKALVGPATCAGGDYREKVSCFGNRVQRVLDEDGLEAAFDEIVALYEIDPDFSYSCHSLTHDLGLHAYRKYEDGVPLTTKVGLCNDGFFHGYMEGFLSAQQNPELARDFCESVRVRFDEVYESAGPQCDHGVGHGIAEFLLHTEPHAPSDIPDIINHALSFCGQYVVHTDSDNVFRCASGVHSVIGDWLWFYPEYGALFSYQDPFLLCRASKSAWAQRGCLWELSKRVRWFFSSEDPKSDFVLPIRHAIQKGAPFANGAYRAEIVRSLAHSSTYKYVLRRPEFFVDLCRSVSLESALQEACVVGVMDGLFAGGRPDEGSVRAVAFCTSNELKQIEQVQCAEALVSSIRSSHEPDDFHEVCELLGDSNLAECDVYKI